MAESKKNGAVPKPQLPRNVEAEQNHGLVGDGERYAAATRDALSSSAGSNNSLGRGCSSTPTAYINLQVFQPQPHRSPSSPLSFDMPQMGATFVPSGLDDYYMPEVVAPSPQRVTPQVPQNMQNDLQRLELEARESATTTAIGEPSPTSVYSQGSQRKPSSSLAATASTNSAAAYPTQRSAEMSRTADPPSFSPFPKVKGDNVPPNDEEKEEILWQAREHVLHSNNVSMQLSWARDTLALVEIVQEAALRDLDGQPRPSTPKIEHTLRMDAVSIVDYLASQEHPEGLFMKSKWLEFGKFGVRQDRKEAYNGYKRSASLGHPRAEYRMGMLYESSNDYSAAVEHYYSGLRQKDSAASYRLGMMSLLGQHGQPKDYQRGLKLINDAADTADEDAPQGAYVYGMLLSRELPEISVPEAYLPYDLSRAKMYLEKAAYLGFAKAQLKIGQAYELCQLGCDFNPAYSIHYYGLAAKQGQPEAALGVSRWFLFGYEGVFSKNEQLAFKFARDAANAKLATGEFAMGYYYEIGIHVSKDLRQARNWYETAAENGNKDASDRLESLRQSKSLTKNDHETTALTRIKSQHGSQRGKRPERFKQPSKAMPTLNESAPTTPTERSPRVSPQPSPRSRPTVVQDGQDFPEPSQAAIQSGHRGPAFGLNLDTNLTGRSKSAAPYPEDERSAAAKYRTPSTAPYPEDDVAGRHLGVRSASGPQADRPGSAFGIRTGEPRGRSPYGEGIRGSQSMANLVPPAGTDPRGRPPPGPSGYRQPSPGPGGYPPQQGMQRPPPASAAPYPPTPLGGPASNKLTKPGPGGPAGYGQPQPGPGRGGPPPRNHGTPGPPPQVSRHYDPRIVSRHSPAPGSRPERYDSVPDSPADSRASSMQSVQTMPAGNVRPPSSRPEFDRVGSAPPAGQPRPHPSPQLAPQSAPQPAAPPKPSKQPTQGPATFEEMGIPQGKGDDQCVVM